MLNQIEELCRLVRVLTRDTNKNFPDPDRYVTAILRKHGFVCFDRFNGRQIIDRASVLASLESGEFDRLPDVGYSTKISVIRYLIDNPNA